MLLSWGVTSYYFEAGVPNEVIDNLGYLLLLPVRLTDDLLNLFNQLTISGNPLPMFLVLWIAYALPLLRLYPLLMVKDHPVSDLKKWYENRYGISK